MHFQPMRSFSAPWRTVLLAAGGLALAMIGGRAEPASAAEITTCQAIGCPGQYFHCAWYSWGGPHPGREECFTNILPGQG